MSPLKTPGAGRWMSSGQAGWGQGHRWARPDRAELAREEVEATRAGVSSALTNLLAHGDPAAVSAVEAAVVSARDLGDPIPLIDALAAAGHAHLLVGDANAACADSLECLDLARRHGDDRGAAQALVTLGGARAVLGEYPQAHAALSEAVRLAQTVRDAHAAALALVWRGETARRQGDAGRAEEFFSLVAPAPLDDPFPVAQALVGLGRIALDTGDAGGALKNFQCAQELAADAALAYLLAPSLAGMAAATNDPTSAQSMLDEALAAAQGCDDPVGEAIALEGLARLSAARGDVRGAIERHAQAVEIRAGVGDPAAIADSLEALACMAAAHDQLVSARLLGAAQRLRTRHGCVRPAARTSDHLAAVDSVRQGLGSETFEAELAAGAALSPEAAVVYAVRYRRKPARPESGWDALTPTERQVAELTIEGRPNNDIAEELGIAPATVKAHLRRVFAKAGVRNRTELAADFYRRKGGP